MVDSFLRRQAEAAAHLPAERRARAVDLLRQRIRKAVEAHPAEALEDTEVKSVLREVVDGLRKPSAASGDGLRTNPEKPVEEQAPKRSAKPVRVVEDDSDDFGPDAVRSRDRVWLGVCLALSDRLGFPVLVLRTAFVAAGVVTGPIALMVYLALYFPARREAEGPPRIDWARVVLGMVAAAAWVLTLYGIGIAYMAVGNMLYQELVGRPPVLGEWDWLRSRHTRFAVWTLLTLAPFGALTGMPVPKEWRGTLKKLLYAGVAFYALAVAYGLGRYTTGLLLLVAEDLAG